MSFHVLRHQGKDESGVEASFSRRLLAKTAPLTQQKISDMVKQQLLSERKLAILPPAFADGNSGSIPSIAAAPRILEVNTFDSFSNEVSEELKSISDAWTAEMIDKLLKESVSVMSSKR